MKTIFSLMVVSLLAVSASSQSVRVSFNGNRNYQLSVDGRTYNSSDYVNNDVVVNNLTGRHTVVISRVNQRGKNKQLYSSTVNLSSNQEVHLTVSNTGGVEREETSSNAAYGYNSPVSDASFNQIYRNVNNQWGQSAKTSTARDVFASTDNYFTTSQVRQIIGLINSEASRLDLAKLSYDNVVDPTNFYQIYTLLSSQASKNELDSYVKNYSYGDTYNSYKVAMSDANFNQLYQNALNQRNNSYKLTAVSNALNSTINYFTVSQARQLISLVTGESNRLQLAKLSLDNIVDMQGINLLFDLFTTQSARDQLDSYIRNSGYADTNYNYNYHTAMTDANFTSLYDNIRKKWLPLTKYSAATDAFNNETNYFTTAQARQIIALLSSESNRLQLAKLSFDNIVDPQNFRQLYDLLSSQTSKDELDEYLRTNYNYQY